LARRSAGRIRVFGYDNQHEWRQARRLIGLSPQEYNFDRYLSIRDVLIFAAGYYGLRGTAVAERADALLERFGLASHSHLEYTKISGGQKRRLSLARALVHQPRLLILDEPTAGVDVELRLELWQWLRTLNAEGLTIFLTTHYLEEAEELCKRIAIVRAGRIVTEKPTEALVAEGASLQDVFLELTRN
jgi:ABC-2 type transport system ATP-binding protein